MKSCHRSPHSAVPSNPLLPGSWPRFERNGRPAVVPLNIHYRVPRGRAHLPQTTPSRPATQSTEGDCERNGGRKQIARRFGEYLARRGLDWPTGIELGSLDLIETYVQQRLGIGLSVSIPGETLRPQIRELPLNDIPGVKVGILWRSPLSPVAETLLSQVKERARQLARSPLTVPPPIKPGIRKPVTRR